MKFNTVSTLKSGNMKDVASKSGRLLHLYNTEELATLLLHTPGQMYTFSTTLDDISDDSLRTVYPWPWYGIVVEKLFDVYSVFINRWTIDGGAPTMFDLPMYDFYKDDITTGYAVDEIPEDLLEIMIEGLTRFNRLHGGVADTWFVDDEGCGSVSMVVNSL